MVTGVELHWQTALYKLRENLSISLNRVKKGEVAMTGEAFWAEVDARLRDTVPALSYKLWLKELVVVGFDGTTLDLGVRDAFYRSWLIKRYGNVLLDAVAETGHDIGVNLVLLPKVELPPISDEPSIPLVRRPNQ